MPPTSDGVRTVGCALSKLVPDEAHLRTIQGAVLSVHRATILATELLNMHLRQCLARNADTDLSSFFDVSWILNDYNEITTGKKTVKVRKLENFFFHVSTCKINMYEHKRRYGCECTERNPMSGKTLSKYFRATRVKTSGTRFPRKHTSKNEPAEPIFHHTRVSKL